MTAAILLALASALNFAAYSATGQVANLVAGVLCGILMLLVALSVER